MNCLRSAVATTVFTLAAIHSGVAAAGRSIELSYNGIATPNTRAAPALQSYTDWCAATSTQGCIPTVQQPMYDSASGEQKGTIYVWAALPFNPGSLIPSSFCFSEFFVFALDGGEIYAHSGLNGTCGATMDPVLKPPIHQDLGALSVIAGGGDGVVVGGTRRYRNWTGTFTDRVFVGFGAPASGVGGIIYYDQLLFSITGP